MSSQSFSNDLLSYLSALKNKGFNLSDTEKTGIITAYHIGMAASMRICYDDNPLSIIRKCTEILLYLKEIEKMPNEDVKTYFESLDFISDFTK